LDTAPLPELPKKITVVSAVKNEGEGIDFLMMSLQKQTRQPEEIVIVDRGSNDGTWERLRTWQKKMKNLKVIREDGANTARGRNTAIKAAKTPYIASIEGDCIAEANWLERLAEKRGDVISGRFVPDARNFREKLRAVFVRRPGTKNPSPKSFMFKKKCWEKAGGYPENLRTGESRAFNSALEKNGCTFTPAEDAVVRWRLRV
jgi:glycosyltransferase involved in cell wall biosynthesis